MNRSESVLVEKEAQIVGRVSSDRPINESRHRPQIDAMSSSPVEEAKPRTLRQRVQRVLLNIGLSATVAAIFVAIMPASVARSDLMVPAQPYLSALGLSECWGVFAPNPRSQVIFASGHIVYSDGTASVWEFPIRPGIMAYSDYRWQKYEEKVRLDSYRGLWKPFSEYLVKHEATPGKTPVQVGLARRWADIKPPGSSTSLGPWSKYIYSVMNVRGAK